VKCPNELFKYVLFVFYFLHYASCLVYCVIIIIIIIIIIIHNGNRHTCLILSLVQ